MAVWIGVPDSDVAGDVLNYQGTQIDTYPMGTANKCGQAKKQPSYLGFLKHKTSIPGKLFPLS